MKEVRDVFPEITDEMKSMLQRNCFSDKSPFDNFFDSIGFYEKHDFFDFIFFKEENVLCGSYEEHYGLLEVTDYSKKKNDPIVLKSIAEQLSESRDSSYKNTYNYPYAIQQYIAEAYGKNSKTYFSNHKSIRNQCRFDTHTWKGSFIEDSALIQSLPEDIKPSAPDWEEHKCSSNTLSNKELIEVTLYINSLPNSKDIFEHIEKEVEKDYLDTFDEVASDKASYPSIERPIIVRLAGNDDTSYSKAVATPEEAYEVYKALKERGNSEEFHSLIKQLKMSFTN